MSLYLRIFLLNALVLIVGTALLLAGPVTVSTPVLFTESLILVAGLAVILVANAALLRVGLRPLQRLTKTMTTIDLLDTTRRPVTGGNRETVELIRAFNAMLDRLAAERGKSTKLALAAQERERRRVAQELHDEVGQTLTAVLLQLKRVADRAPADLRLELSQVQETTRDSLDEIRRIARRLRPGVLAELGLVSALRSLANEVSAAARPLARCHIGPDLPALSDQAELVVYRVAQESVTNVVRHAAAETLTIELVAVPGGVQLRVTDDGSGIGDRSDGAGIRGMRERALLIDAWLTIEPGEFSGTEVALRVPAPAVELTGSTA